MTTNNTWLTMTAATVPVSGSTDGIYPAERCLVGIGLFVARHEDGTWRFARRAHATSAGTPESVLLRFAADRLPGDGQLIGWNVNSALIPALLDAAATAPPIIARNFTASLHSILRSGVVDMALDHGGAAAPPLATVAADRAIYFPVMGEGPIISAWATGLVSQLRRDLADEALAIWQLFIRSAGAGGLEVEAATNAWVLRRQRMVAPKRNGNAR